KPILNSWWTPRTTATERATFVNCVNNHATSPMIHSRRPAPVFLAAARTSSCRPFVSSFTASTTMTLFPGPNMAWPPLLDVVLDPPDDVVDFASEDRFAQHLLAEKLLHKPLQPEAHDDDPGDLGNDLDLPLSH